MQIIKQLFSKKLYFVKWSLQFIVFLHFIIKLFGSLNYFLYLCSEFKKGV